MRTEREGQVGDASLTENENSVQSAVKLPKGSPHFTQLKTDTFFTFVFSLSVLPVFYS